MMQKFLMLVVATLFVSVCNAANFQKATFKGDWEGKSNVSITILLEDKGVKDGVWTRVLYYGTADIKNDSLGVATHTYKEIKPGKFQERISDGDKNVVGETTLIGKIDNWVEFKSVRKNLCKIGVTAKQDLNSKDCKYEQRIVCEKSPQGDKCTDTFFLNQKIVGSPHITQFIVLDAKTFGDEVAKVIKQ